MPLVNDRNGLPVNHKNAIGLCQNTQMVLTAHFNFEDDALLIVKDKTMGILHLGLTL